MPTTDNGFTGLFGGSDLVRRRRAHDLWISRGHLWAGATAMVLLMGISFSMGYKLGTATVRPDGGAEAFLVDVPDDSLVELLARVQASADPDGGVNDLTFPEVLANPTSVVQVPEKPPADSPHVVVKPPGPEM